MAVLTSQFFLSDKNGEVDMPSRINGGRASLRQEVDFDSLYICPQKMGHASRPSHRLMGLETCTRQCSTVLEAAGRSEIGRQEWFSQLRQKVWVAFMCHNSSIKYSTAWKRFGSIQLPSARVTWWNVEPRRSANWTI